MCGENGLKRWVPVAGCGSPPRVRGKLTRSIYAARARRITPACAGKTMLLCAFMIASADHPRVCGENKRFTLELKKGDGSPPRVRGKRSPIMTINSSVRITPACAGKTHGFHLLHSVGADHPRVCGENHNRAPFECVPRGSPPRVRGKHFGNGVFPWLILVLSLDPL